MLSRPTLAAVWPLFKMIEAGDAQGLAKLIEKGASIGWVHPNYGVSLTGMATSLGYLSCLKVLIGAGGSVEDRFPEGYGDIGGWTLLGVAIGRGQLDLARELLACGADPLARQPFGLTVLMAAAASGRAEGVRLVEPASDLARIDDEGKSAAQWAHEVGSEDVGHWLEARLEARGIAAVAPEKSKGFKSGAASQRL
jgi:hypothetical protein